MRKAQRWIVLCLAILLAAAAASCSYILPAENLVSRNPSSAGGFTFQDSLNNRVLLKGKPVRVVSLMGSYAEAWTLAGGTLVGTTDDAVTERGMKLGPDVADIGNVQEPSAEKVLSLSPDFVILSAELQTHLALDETLRKAGIPHAYFRVDAVSEYLSMMKTFTDLTGRPDLYQKNGAAVQQRVEQVLNGVKRTEKKPKVLFLRTSSLGVQTQKSSTMTGTMLQDLNCDNIADDSPSLLQDLNLEVILRDDPDYIFVTTMGSSTKKAVDALKAFENHPAWSQLTAVKRKRCIILPKELFQYKPNARWGEAYEYLEKILYPDSSPEN